MRYALAALPHLTGKYAFRVAKEPAASAAGFCLGTGQVANGRARKKARERGDPLPVTCAASAEAWLSALWVRVVADAGARAKRARHRCLGCAFEVLLVPGAASRRAVAQWPALR